MSWVRPPHISEREDAHRWPDGQYDDAADEDCVWCSGLRQYLGAVPGGAPATHDEAERLRQTAGLPPGGGSNSLDLQRGVKARYGYDLTIIASGIDSLKQFLVPGRIATVSGKLSNFPSGHRLRRFYPYFTGGHRVSVSNEDGVLWWDDPGGPQTGYSGEKVTWTELATFVKGGISHTLAPLAQEADMVVVTDETVKKVGLAVGAQLYDLAGAPKVKVSTAQTANSPYGTSIGGTAYRVFAVTTGGIRQQVLAKIGSAGVTVTDVPPPTALAAGLYRVG